MAVALTQEPTEQALTAAEMVALQEHQEQLTQVAVVVVLIYLQITQAATADQVL